MDIDKRINEILVQYEVPMQQEMIKKLISVVVDYVTPEKESIDPAQFKSLSARDLDAVGKKLGHNYALARIETKRKELGI